jgi:hypothetical protein
VRCVIAHFLYGLLRERVKGGGGGGWHKLDNASVCSTVKSFPSFQLFRDNGRLKSSENRRDKQTFSQLLNFNFHA